MSDPFYHQNFFKNGITIGNTTLKVSQLADDTLYYVNDMSSVKELIITFDDFNKLPGLKVNIDKTSVTTIGNINLDKEINIKWQELPNETLGIKTTGKTSTHYKLNFQEKNVKLEKLLNVWKRRKLTLKGKIIYIIYYYMFVLH